MHSKLESKWYMSLVYFTLAILCDIIINCELLYISNIFYCLFEIFTFWFCAERWPWVLLQASINIKLLVFNSPLFLLHSTASCFVCWAKSFHHMGSKFCNWGVPHVLWWPWLLSQQRFTGHLCWVHTNLHIRGREYCHDAADCKVITQKEKCPLFIRQAQTYTSLLLLL